jgi:hypothetical protein
MNQRGGLHSLKSIHPIKVNNFAKKKPGILGKDSGRLDETMRIGEYGIVISQS